MRARAGVRIGIALAALAVQPDLWGNCGVWGVANAQAAAQPDGKRIPFPEDWYLEGARTPASLKALEGKPAPGLSISKWIGTPNSSEANRGKVVIVDFWATWCPPCMRSLPHNVELDKKYADKGVVFVGVHDSKRGWDKAPEVVRSLGIKYSVGLDNSNQSIKAYGLQFWPTYVAIDRAGVVRAAGLAPGHVEDVIKILLAEAPPPGMEVSEFGPEFYVSGKARPAALRRLEGQPAPELRSSAWAGGKASGQSSIKDAVSVITFVSPVTQPSLHELEKIAPVYQEFVPRGVVFVGVADGRPADAAWDKVGQFLAAKHVDQPVMRDEIEAGKSGVRSSVTLGAWGIPSCPVTCIVDRKGVVRAAGVKPEKIKPILEKLLAEDANQPPAKAPSGH